MKNSLHIFVLIAFLLGIIAPACGFMWGGAYSVIEICTAQGLESRVIADNQQPDHPPQTKKQCDFCFQSANLTAYLPKMAALEKISFQSTKIRFSSYKTVLLSRGTSKNSARAPPVFI